MRNFISFKSAKIWKAIFLIAFLLSVNFNFSDHAQGAGTPAFVQGKSSGAWSGNVSTSFNSSTTAGNLIVVTIFGWGTGISGGGISDTQGNSYTLAASDLPGGNTAAHLYYATNIRGGADTISFVWSVGGIVSNMAISEYSGIATTSPLDVVTHNSGTWPLYSLSPGTLNTTVAGDLIYSSMGLAPSTASSPVSSSGWTQRVQDNASLNAYIYTADELTAVIGSYSNTFSNFTAYNGSAFIVAFKPAVAPPPDTTAPSVPNGLSATAVSSSQINLSWSASSDNYGVTGYRVYRAGVQISTSTTTSYSDTGLSMATSYSYTVAAYDATGNLSSQSAAASATTFSPGSYTAASCNLSDVNAVINGPAHMAMDGDTINIPAGNCSWTGGITVPAGIGITVKGLGTPNSTPATMGTSSTCSQTVLTVNSSTVFRMTPAYASTTSRISCMRIIYGSGPSIGASILGACTISGCSKFRMDNVTFDNWSGHADANIGYGITAMDDIFGTLDHNTVNGGGGRYLQMVEFSHGKYQGIGSYGDNSWHQPENYGSSDFLFVENNILNAAGASENEANAGGYETQGGGRIVVRFNQYINMDHLNMAMGWHGTESSGRPRSTRAYEFYGNTYTCAVPDCLGVAASRGGTGLVWGNTINSTSNPPSILHNMGTYRRYSSIGGWGACDGTSPWDTNDGVVYWSGTIASITNPTWDTIVLTFTTSPSWNVNQWIPYGAPYSMHDITQNNGTELEGNTASTLVIRTANQGPGTWMPAVGDSVEITRATACIDQAGGRGAGIMYNNTWPATPETPANEVLSPVYLWSNNFNGAIPRNVAGANSASVIPGREFYTENPNQLVQTNSSTPFNGTIDSEAISSWSCDYLSNSCTFTVPKTSGFKINDYANIYGALAGAATRQSVNGSYLVKTLTATQITVAFAGPANDTGLAGGVVQTPGTGHGTLANRPTTCTPGVGYFATDQGSWNQSGNSFGQGQFYTCTATNTWSLKYTPYTYPHPLIAGSTTNPTPVPGDLNLDHIVNSLDWSIMNSRWFTSDATADINKDGIVNTLDWSIMNSNWFKTW